MGPVLPGEELPAPVGGLLPGLVVVGEKFAPGLVVLLEPEPDGEP